MGVGVVEICCWLVIVGCVWVGVVGVWLFLGKFVCGFGECVGSVCCFLEVGGVYGCGCVLGEILFVEVGGVVFLFCWCVVVVLRFLCVVWSSFM